MKKQTKTKKTVQLMKHFGQEITELALNMENDVLTIGTKSGETIIQLGEGVASQLYPLGKVAKSVRRTINE